MPLHSVKSIGESAGSTTNYGILSLVVASCFTGDATSPQTARYVRFVHITIFLFLTWLLVTGSAGAILLERPVQSSILGFAGCTLVFGCLSAISRCAIGNGRTVEKSIPLADSRDARGNATVSWSDRIPWGPRHRRVLFSALAVVLRVHAFNAVLKDIACSRAGVETLLPVISVLLEHNPNSISRPSAPAGNESRLRAFLRAALPAALISWIAASSARLGSSPRSTIICPATSGVEGWVVLAQVVGLLLDAWVLHSLRTILASNAGRSPAVSFDTPLLAATLSAIATAGIIGSSIAVAIFPSHRHYLSNLDNEYVWANIKIILIVTAMVLSGTQIMLQSSTTDVAVLLSLVTSLTYVRAGYTNDVHAQLHVTWTPNFLLLIFGAAVYYMSGYPTGESSQMRYRRVILYALCAITVGLVIVSGFSEYSGSTKLTSHPLRSLIATADRVHLEWADQAARSKNLEEAVQNYIERYHRHPPPGFDKWWEYATSRHSKVLDDFDLIEENLRPYWKITPARIRQRVKILLADTENECAEVSIRDGVPGIGQVKPTHKWMVEGIIKMMEPFVKELPDMDIAFNINDEPRVAVPYDAWEANARLPSEPEAEALSGTWSTNRGAGWQLRDDEVEESPDMTWFSFKSIWRQYGSINCPPDSPARTTKIWDASTLCTSCFAPHSTGVFLSNWTLAGDPCHQPDLAHLHGFYLSPSAFKATRDLLPIFSQSRTGGFADILYPTAWNYNDKITYSPSDEYPDFNWDKKDTTLFWKGSATEGFSKTGTWRGQTRQRLVNLANNSTQRLPVLLPAKSGKWSYYPLTTPEFLNSPKMHDVGLKTDISFVDKYPRCDDGDCEAQRDHFGLGPTSDFQHHWKHKFLFDADGAGFSGRFLPFLLSQSLPLKTAIFREWYDSRITPWKHFVPVDVRLHGLWSTLAFFAARFESLYEVDHAKFIANDGADWARRVLRKEDMEIYFYRLLLEYARITDDNRAALGYVGKKA